MDQNGMILFDAEDADGDFIMTAPAHVIEITLRVSPALLDQLMRGQVAELKQYDERFGTLTITMQPPEVPSV